MQIKLYVCRKLIHLRVWLVLIMSGLLVPVVYAAPYPERPVTLFLGYPSGGAADTVARLLAEKYSDVFGQPVVVENRPGASGQIATNALTRAAADGYTLLVNTQADSVIAPITMPELTYVPERDLAPVSLLAVVPSVLVVPSTSPYQTVAELVEAAKKQPGTLNYASFGNGSSAHMAAELLKSMVGIEVTHIPYKGSAAATTDLLAGRIDLMFNTVTASKPHIESGKLRALAVTSAERIATLPNIPTMKESGVENYQSLAFLGLVAPVGTPKAIIDKLQSSTSEILGLADVEERMFDLGMVPSSTSPGEFSSFMADETARYRKLIQEANLRFPN